MPILGFNFEKISVVKKKEKKEKQIKIKNSLKIVDVAEEEIPFMKQGNVLKFSFEFNLDYETLGSIDLGGNILYSGNPDEIKGIMKSWKKDKRLPTLLMSSLLNLTMFKCCVKALDLSQEVNLPAPPQIRFPKIEAPAGKAEDYIG